MAIDFTLSPQQQELQADARAFAAQVLAPVAARSDETNDPWDAFVHTPEAVRKWPRPASRNRLFLSTSAA
jgi:alkylation response protein AidB-like acyl-CoA dehydrogenase